MLAVNILRVGMEQPFEPVEMRPLHHISVMHVLSMIAGKPRPLQGGVSSQSIMRNLSSAAGTRQVIPPPLPLGQVLLREPGDIQ